MPSAATRSYVNCCALSSRSPPITALMNGQAVKVAFASTASPRCARRPGGERGRSSRRRSLPPTTTTRGAVPCAERRAGRSAVEAADASLRNSRRLASCCVGTRRRSLDLLVGEALGDPVHDGGRELARAEVLHGSHDRRLIQPGQQRGTGDVTRGRAGMTAEHDAATPAAPPDATVAAAIEASPIAAARVLPMRLHQGDCRAGYSAAPCGCACRSRRRTR